MEMSRMKHVGWEKLAFGVSGGGWRERTGECRREKRRQGRREDEPRGAETGKMSNRGGENEGRQGQEAGGETEEKKSRRRTADKVERREGQLQKEKEVVGWAGLSIGGLGHV